MTAFLKLITFLLPSALCLLPSQAQRTDLGTEIWIEPGYSKADIAKWCKYPQMPELRTSGYS